MKKFISVLFIVTATLGSFSSAVIAAPAKEKANAMQMKTQKLNINQASIDQLITLPGLGKKKAAAIVDYREQNGDFRSVNDLTAVKGIGDKMLAKLHEHIDVK